MTQTTEDGAVATVTPAALKGRIDAGEDVFLLDARNEDAVEEWQIEGETVDSINIPYFAFLSDDLPDAVEQLPSDQRLTVLCAKGGSSSMVVEELVDAGYDAEHLEDGMQGWARLYESQVIDADANGATVVQYRRPSSGCLAYLVADGDEAAVVDPLREFTDQYVEDARELGVDITAAVDTHIHADHISGVRALADATNATVVLPAAAADRGVDYEIGYETVEDGDTIPVGGVELDVLHTPGHTSGMTSYRVGDVLFTGDGLFLESVARPDLEDDDEDAIRDAAATLYDSLQVIRDLPRDTVVAPAHFSNATERADDGTYTETLGTLVDTLDPLTMEKDAFQAFVGADVPPRPANYADIIEINLGRHEATDDEAFELELGPNNCAASQDAATSD